MIGYAAGSLLLGVLLLAAAWRSCRGAGAGAAARRRRLVLLPLLVPASGACFGFAALLLGWIAAGQPAAAAEVWHPGVSYRRLVSDRPGEGPVVLHAVEVDLAAARPAFSLWPEPLLDGGTDFEDRVGRQLVTTGSDAAGATDADLVLNASHFGPMYGDLLFWSYPRRGDPVLPMGAVETGGEAFGVPVEAWPRVRLGPVAFAGRSVLVAAGRPTPRDGHLSANRYPRCAIGVDAAGERLFLVVVDGKQPRRSVGLTLAALADRLVTLGAHTAVELDGGGSAQLTRRLPGGAVAVVNSPSHQKLPRWERPVANHLVMRFGG